MNLHFDPKFYQVYVYSCFLQNNTIAGFFYGTALEPDFLSISSPDAWSTTVYLYIYIYSEAW